MKGANAMTEYDKSILKNTLPKHYANMCIVNNIPLEKISPIMLGHLKLYNTYKAKKEEQQIKDMTEKAIEEAVAEELEKSIKQMLKK